MMTWQTMPLSTRSARRCVLSNLARSCNRLHNTMDKTPANRSQMSSVTFEAVTIVLCRAIFLRLDLHIWHQIVPSDANMPSINEGIDMPWGVIDTLFTYLGLVCEYGSRKAVVGSRWESLCANFPGSEQLNFQSTRVGKSTRLY